MRRSLAKTIAFILLLTALGLTRAVAQAPPPTSDWTKDDANPVLQSGSTADWDSGAVYAPSVVGNAGTFEMWYTGTVATDTAVVPAAIGRSTSTDGTEWTKDAHNPVLSGGLPGEWDAAGVAGPAVLEADGVYHLWYTGEDEAGTRRIGYATSPDGVSWTVHAQNPVLEPGPEDAWDSRAVRAGSVLQIDGTYHLWYTGVNAAGTTSIGYATSPDGAAWTKQGDIPVLWPAATWDEFGVYSPTVIFDGETYRMWYTGVNAGGDVRIGSATSENGTDWTRDPDNPLLAPSEAGAWDATAVSQPAIVYDAESTTYHLWYTGQGQDVRQIGHATAEAGHRVYLPLIRRTE